MTLATILEGHMGEHVNIEVLADYRGWLSTWAEPNTVEARVTVARAFLVDCGGVDGIDQRSVVAFLNKPKSNGARKSRWTRATYHGHVKSFCEYLQTAEVLDADDDPMGGTKSPKRPKDLPRPLTELEVKRVLAKADGDVRDWITIALATGLRVSEIAKLRGVDVSSEGIYVRGKGSVAATLPSHPDVLEIALRKDRGYWWPGDDEGHVRSQAISRRVGDLFRTLGIQGSVHRCRHTYGTRLLRSGVNIRKVQQLMRHANLTTTATYTAVDEDELRDAILLLPSSNPPTPPPDAA